MKKVLEIFKFLFKTRFTRLIVKKDIIIYLLTKYVEGLSPVGF